MNIKKIAVIGPESTGKTTLSKALAKKLQTVYVPEHARIYIDLLKTAYSETDLLQIAKGQLQSEDELIKSANGLLICDTDLYIVKVWSEHKYNNCYQWVLRSIAERPYDFYLLTDIDMDWEDDPQREYPEPAMRQYFYKQYFDIVQNTGVPFAVINGTPKQRLDKALKVIEEFID